MSVAELGDYLVPVRGVAQDGSGDASAAWAGEQACVGIGTDRQDALGDEWADFPTMGALAGALVLGALVGQPFMPPRRNGQQHPDEPPLRIRQFMTTYHPSVIHYTRSFEGTTWRRP